MTQSVLIQVGQCGNQIGCQFWDLALREHAAYNKSAIFDEPLSSFFRNVDLKKNEDIPLGDGRRKIRALKARAVLVDMEEGVINQLLKGPLKDVFDSKQLITDYSGSGNNWAVGHKHYGQKYCDKLLNLLRKSSEECDCLQTFFILHSMGGGTGSGIGTYFLKMIQDEFPKIYRFVVAVYPSADDDVITSPYNSVLAMQQLTESADCVIPIENQALIDISHKVKVMSKKSHNRYKSDSKAMKSDSSITHSTGGATNDQKPFDQMNNIVANMMLNLTSSCRFEGSLNVDLNEITTNLVPYPHLHYLTSSMAPLYSPLDCNMHLNRLDHVFSDAFSKECQLIQANPSYSTYLACALILRGKIHMSEIRQNIDRLQSKLTFVPWNREGWKVGLCQVPPVGLPYSLLTLTNNTCITRSFETLRQRFQHLYRRKLITKRISASLETENQKFLIHSNNVFATEWITNHAHVHHYLQVDGMEDADFKSSYHSLQSLISEYQALDSQTNRNFQTLPRLQVIA